MSPGTAVSIATLLLVAVLVVMLVRMQRQLRRLRTDLERLDHRWEGDVPAEPAASAQATPAPRVDLVPLITAIDQTSDDEGPQQPRIASVTPSGPLVKVVAFSHGLRRALDEERRMRMASVVRRELRRQRKLRRRRRAARAPAEGWRT